jgi:type I restriction enzyme M protein
MAKTKKDQPEEPLEKKLWKTADKLRKNMDAAEYKHVVLGLIFLKYISDAFEELFQKLTAEKGEGADPEDKNEYTAEKVFYVPKSARWKWVVEPTPAVKTTQIVTKITELPVSLNNKIYHEKKMSTAK